MVLLGLGLWLGLQRLHRGQPQEAANNPNPPSPGNPGLSPSSSPNKKQDELAGLPNPVQKNKTAGRHRINPTLVAKNSNKAGTRVRKETVEDRQLADAELQQGKAAKEQLMLALRVASAKLSFAQKKTLGTSPRDPVHNQHKNG
jgi:hypothetical protein